MLEENRKVYEFDNFRLDVSERQLLKDESLVTIPPKAFDLLVILVESNGTLIERESLSARVWPESIVEDANLTVHISTIRKVLGEPSCISTVSGHGYRFNWPVKEVNGVAGLETTVVRREETQSNKAGNLLLVQQDSGQKPHAHQPDARLERDTPNRPTFMTSIIGALMVMAISIGAYFYYASGSETHIQSIAVMPFANETGNPDLEYLSDGMTVSVISSLSRLPDINVKARSSVFRYKGKNKDARTIGEELRVQGLLIGRLVQRGDDVTLFVELIEPVTEKILWSGNYNRSMANLVTLQGDIARDVSRNLRATLSDSQKQQLAKRDTAEPEAYQLYLRGRYHWKRREPEDLRKSIDYFNRAILIDPNYAKAYAGLADGYALYYDSIGDYSAERKAIAKESVLKALSLDDGLAEAHASLGLILYNNFDFAGAERELKRAIELDPNYSPAHHWYGNLFGALGRFDEMFAEHRVAMELEPLSPLMTGVYGVGLAWARRYDEALVQLLASLELDPNRSGAYFTIGFAYEGKGDHAKAVDHYARAEEMRNRGEAASKMRKAFAIGGWQAFRRVLVDPAVTPWSYGRARGYASLGQKDRAFELLNEAYEIREPRLRNLKIDPYFDGVRDDPRYLELVRKVGFPE